MKTWKIFWMLAIGLLLSGTSDAELVGYWHFNENTGTIAHDKSDYHNDGTIDMLGTVWTEGKYGSA